MPNPMAIAGAHENEGTAGTSSTNRPLLSICISTLNRASFIGETLASIVQQLSDQVELLIVDGASTDGTVGVVQPYLDACRYVRYVRLPKNGGADADYDRTVELAHGEYCWLMTDDDLILPTAVAAVLGAIANNPLLIIVNAEVRNADFSRLLEAKRLRIRQDRIFQGSEWNEFAALTCRYLSFIGGVVIQRAIWLGRERAKYYGSYFIHLGVIFQRRIQGPLHVIAMPCISIRYGNAMWRPRDFEVWNFMWPNLVWSLDSLSQATKLKICPRHPWSKWKAALYFRAKGSYSLAEYRNLVAPTGAGIGKRLPALVAACFPGWLANLIALGAAHLVPSRSGMRILDLRSSKFYPFQKAQR